MMVCMDVYLRYTRSCHDMESQLVPFAAPPSVLGTLPLFSSSSRRDANKRWVRSAFGCKCSISVTQDDRATDRGETKPAKWEKRSTRTSLQHEMSLSTSIVWAFCASSSSFRIC